MGIDYNTYLGPYVEYRVRLTVTTRSRCREPDTCPKPTSGFCQKCGLRTPIPSDLVVTTGPEINILDDALMDGFGSEDIGSKTSTYRLIPDDRRDGWPRDFLFDAKYDEGCVNIDPAQIEAEKTWFADAFAPEIAKLTEAGALDLEVRWGLMVWQS